MSDITTVDRPRNRGGRPATGQRPHVVEMTLWDDELLLLDTLLTRRGKGRGRATLLRDLLLQEARSAGITIPGARAAEAEVTAA